MKMAGWSLGILGGYILATLIIAGFLAVPDSKATGGMPYIEAIVVAAPYTALLMIAFSLRSGREP